MRREQLLTKREPETDRDKAADATEVAANEIRVGGRLRHARLVKDATLKQISELAGCSESMLSKIENGKTYPSLPMLHRLAEALGTNLSALLASAQEEDTVVSLPDQRANYIVHGHGIRLERLIPYADQHLLQSNILWIAPGASVDGEFTHQGEELGYVLEGEIELTVAGKTYRAEAGASFHFRSELAHSYRNTRDVPARVLWVSTPPTF